MQPLLEYYLGMDAELKTRLRRLGRYPAKDLRAFYAKHEEQQATIKSGKRAGKEYTKHHWERRLHTAPDDRELLTRHEMVHGAGTLPGHSPDVLVTNYSMLEYMLMRPFERPIFDETRRWLAAGGQPADAGARRSAHVPRAPREPRWRSCCDASVPGSASTTDRTNCG